MTEGQGGGAIQIVSRSEIRINEGILDANGLGDNSRLASTTGASLATGGGSGGGILLEAPRVTLGFGSGIFANGAGGTGGCNERGEDGRRATSQAAGGACDTQGDGGAGGAQGGPAGNGTAGDLAGGAGGGGAGRIRINITAGGLTVDEGALVSPAASIGVIRTR